MTATNINWDVNLEDALETLNEFSIASAASALGISTEAFADMDEDERRDYARNVFSRHLSRRYELMGLPESVRIPETLGSDAEKISDWLSDEYRFCHAGFLLIDD